jgi:hypothetical protein
MEVTNVQDKITHAVIGKHEVQSFGMSEDAELYHILSNALYSRKKEAAIREILCNAWDSHIDSGIENVAVKITLTSEKLVVTDFGEGIAPENIKSVYGTYGKSTKKHDGKQTGGFGLGSKAPFAYTDHFEVNSSHDGTKTIYKMSQSNAQVGGKPGILPLVSVPTEETGLSVGFSLKDENDRFEFESLIKRIVEMGDMNVTLNDEKLPTIPFNEAVNNFMLVDAERFRATSHSAHSEAVYIRYGHVIYPLNLDDRYTHLYQEVQAFLIKASKADDYTYSNRSTVNKKWVLILQAEPHSISVTPSREDLSMTDKTVNQITEMLRNFVDFSRNKLENKCKIMFAEVIDKVWILSSPKVLFDDFGKIPLKEIIPEDETNYVYDFDELTRRYMKHSYPSFDGFKQLDMNTRLTSLSVSGFADRGLVRSFKKTYNNKNKDLRLDWFHRTFISRIFRDNDDGISLDRLYVYTKVNVARRKYGQDMQLSTKAVSEYKPQNLTDLYGFLRKIVIISHSKASDSLHRADGFPIIKNWLGDKRSSLVYVVARSPSKKEKALKHFRKLGFNIIDLTVRHPWEPQEVKAIVAPKAPQKARKKGIPKLSAMNDVLLGSRYHTGNLWNDAAPRIEDPEFILKISSRRDTCHGFPSDIHINEKAANAIIRKYGHLGGVVQNASQQEKFTMAGASEMKPWLAKKLLEEYENNPLIAQHYKESLSHRDDTDSLSYDEGRLYKIVQRNKILQTHFKLSDPIEQDEKDIIEIYESYNRWDSTTYPELKEIKKLIDGWKLYKNSKKLADQLRNNKLLDIYALSYVEGIMRNTNKTYTPKQVEAVQNMLILTIEG